MCMKISDHTHFSRLGRSTQYMYGGFPKATKICRTGFVPKFVEAHTPYWERICSFVTNADTDIFCHIDLIPITARSSVQHYLRY